MSRTTKLILGLEENATDSLAHAVDHFTDGKRPTDLKYAVLHVFHAVELFLKARLGKAHPSLIYEKPEDATKQSARTVDFNTLVARLRADTVEVSEADRGDLTAIRNERNRIEHHNVELDHKKVSAWIGRAMRFLDVFVEKELGIRLRDKLDVKTYQTLQDAIYSYEERISKAKASLPAWHPKHNPEQHAAWCPECGQETVPCPDDDSKDGMVGCRFCGERFYANSCPRCGGVMLLSVAFSRETDPGVCDDCWANLPSD